MAATAESRTWRGFISYLWVKGGTAIYRR
jgi:hypothetical protein